MDAALRWYNQRPQNCVRRSESETFHQDLAVLEVFL